MAVGTDAGGVMRPSHAAAGRLGAATLVAALATAGAIAPAVGAGSGSPGRDLPGDAPPAVARTLAAGGTTLTVDDAARKARLRVDDGGSLDQYLYGPGPITFDIDLQGFSPDPAAGQPVELRMFVFDVDQAGSEECGPEVDRVSVNGQPVGTLTGANDQWIVNTFTVPEGALDGGTNAFRVDIDTGGTGCWAVQVDWAEITLPFAIGHVATDATDDVDIRRGVSTDEIPDRVFERTFDASGALTAPTADDPVADAMNDSHWFSGPTAGRFTYGYTLDAWPAKPDWTPTVVARWQFSGTGGSGAGPAAGVEGWEGELEIAVPTRTGKYDLTVWLEIRKDGQRLVEQQRTTTVYVLLGEPVDGGVFGPDTGTPKTQWLDRAFELGAAGWSAPTIILQTMMIRIYRNPLGWTYVGSGPYSTPEELIEGTGTRGECYTFRDVWWILALSLGINASTNGYAEANFVSGTRPALDGNASANAIPAAGGSADRWVFGSHGWGTYGGNRYDPTFGIFNVDTPAAFETDSVLCKEFGANASGRLCGEIGGGSAVYLVTPTGTTNATGWPTNTYQLLPPPPPSPPGPAPQPFAAVGTLAALPASDAGEDTDGNGQSDWLRVDVPVSAPVDGQYTLLLTLAAPDGTYLATGTLDPAARATLALVTTLTAGEHTVAVRFPGRAVRAGGVDGPYTVTGDVRAPDGSVLGSVAHTTQAYDHRTFQGPLATVGTGTDEVVGDQLRLHVPITPTGSGPVAVRAQVLAGGTQVGAAARDVVLAAGTPQDVTLDVATAPIWASGLDGPYTVHLSVRDASSETSLAHTTAAYDADAFAPPPVRLGPDVTDAGVDDDGDGLFDTLDVAAEVVATTSGPVTVHASVQADDGTAVTTATVTLDAGPAPTPVALAFSGRDIAGAGADGPYDVALTVSDASGVHVSRTHRTGPYTAAQFDAPVALLTGAYTDAAVDTNGDTAPDVLRVEAGVTLPAAADVTLRGTLVDEAGDAVTTATVTTSAAAGPGTLTMDFDGADLAAHAVPGPYVLTGVELGRPGEEPEVTALDVHTTAAYAADLFRPGGAFHIENVIDRGQDDDGDGLFDALAVDVVVQVQQAGYYSANGRLTDGTGEEIQWAGEQQYLDVGSNALTLRFDGRLISGRAVDGPYRVESLSVYVDPTRPVTLRTPHLTAAYGWQEFEAGAAFTGHVTSDGVPLAGVAVAVPGQAFDVTDATGAYRLGLLGGGTYEVVLTADPALAPWRILVGGVEQATGTSVLADVADGATTTVDFVRGTAAPASGYQALAGDTIADTRTGDGVPRGRLGPLGADVVVAGRGGVPDAGVAAVVLRVQVLDPQRFGELVVRPSDGTVPVDPQVAYGFDDTTGLAVVPLGADGAVHLGATLGRPHVVVSVAGYLPAGGSAPAYTPVTPTRLPSASTCRGVVRVPCATDVQVTGLAGVPGSGVGAVVLTVAAVRPLAWGTVWVHGTSDPLPRVPTLTHGWLRPAATTVVAPVDDAGEVRVSAVGARTHRLSVVGWLPTGTATPVPSTPVATTSTTTDVQVTGVAGVPATGVGAVVLQVSQAGGARGGTLTVHPADAPAPATPDLRAPRWGTATGLVVVAPGADGTVRLTVTGNGTRVQTAVVGWLPGG